MTTNYTSTQANKSTTFSHLTYLYNVVYTLSTTDEAYSNKDISTEEARAFRPQVTRGDTCSVGDFGDNIATSITCPNSLNTNVS
jgi:hypothetical protein